jgi:hypothetical protein
VGEFHQYILRIITAEPRESVTDFAQDSGYTLLNVIVSRPRQLSVRIKIRAENH